MARLPTFTLTVSEEKLLEQIEFTGAPEDTQGASSRGAAGKLAKSLFARRVIPKARLSYFVDAKFNVGSTLSRREQFERNGTRGDEILVHPHFLKYLEYFIFGPDLPTEAITALSDRVKEEEFISGSDIPELCDIVRRQTSRHRLAPRTAADEFFKLAIECGLDLSVARQIRDAAARVRLSQTG
jgi:hypothetical protein